MKNNTSDFAMGGYSEQVEVESGMTSLVTGILENLRKFLIRMRQEQVKNKRQSDSKRAALRQFQQESSKRMPLEKLIRMGFYHF
jgi:hypothetical protein